MRQELMASSAPLTGTFASNLGIMEVVLGVAPDL